MLPRSGVKFRCEKLWKYLWDFFTNNKKIVLGSNVVERRLKRYILSNNTALERIVTTFKLDKKQYLITDIDEWEPRKCTGFIGSVLEKAFGLSYVTGAQSRKERFPCCRHQGNLGL